MSKWVPKWLLVALKVTSNNRLRMNSCYLWALKRITINFSFRQKIHRYTDNSLKIRNCSIFYHRPKKETKNIMKFTNIKIVMAVKACIAMGEILILIPNVSVTIEIHINCFLKILATIHCVIDKGSNHIPSSQRVRWRHTYTYENFLWPFKYHNNVFRNKTVHWAEQIKRPSL